MTRALVALAVLLAGATAASAAPRKVMVLRAEGKLDDAARAKLDAAVLAHARRLDGEISPAEITFADATAAVGCTGDVATCADQVLDTLAVDELVVVTVEPAPGGEVMVTVERVSKSSRRELTGRVPAASPEPALTDAVGPLFGFSATATAMSATISSGATAPAEPISPWDQLPPDTAPPPAAAEPAVTAAPAHVVTAPEGGRRTRRLAIAGLAGGGALMVIGVVLWNAASSKQAEIDDAPTQTRDDLLHLQDLESSADAYALWGNVTFFGGVALAGAGGFLLWRGGSRAAPTSAWLVPIAVGDGGGLAVKIGAEP